MASNPKKPAIDLRELKRTLHALSIENQITELYRKGYHADGISEILGIPLARVHYTLRLQELAPAGRHALTLLMEGYSPDEVADLLRSQPGEISELAGEMGLDIPTITKQKSKKSTQPHPATMRERVTELCRSTKMNYKQIAEIFGLPRRTVNRWCSKLRGPVKRTLSKNQQINIRKYRQEGWSWERLSKKYGVSATTLKKLAQRRYRV